MSAPKMAPSIEVLLYALDRAYGRASWHGVNLRGSVRRVSAVDAAWRPRASRHNIHETVVHCAYWKYAVWRRLTGAKRGSFPLKGSNWFTRPVAVADRSRQWRDDLALLDRAHTDLREAVAAFPAASLYRRARGLKTSALDLIAGATAHDLYHAGQIQLLKALRKSR